MNSKERGLQPFKERSFDRFPMWYGGDPETTKNIREYLGAETDDQALYQIIGIDYKTVRPRYIGTPFEAQEDGTVLTDWGIKRAGLHYGQAMNSPLKNAQTVEDILNYKFPDVDNYDCRITEDEIKAMEGYCVIGGAWSPFFHDSAELLGMEKYLMDMYFNPEMVDCLIGKCFDFYYELTKRMFEKNPGIIDFHFFGNDFGTQRAMMFSPEMWTKFFKPRVRKFVDLAHKHGAVCGMHSCGSIHQIFPDLIDTGLDVINPIQVNADGMQPEILKREYGKDIVFFGGIDENEILLNRTTEEVRAETRRIIDILGSDGKYIVAASHDYLLPEVPAENIVAMYDEAKKYGLGIYG